MKVAICMPSGDMMHTDCAFSIMNMMCHVVRNRKDIHLFLFNEKQTILEVGRHRLVCLAIGIDVDYILWIDTDMQFSVDFLTRLVDSGKDIIGVQAIMRSPPHASNTYDMDNKQVLYDPGIKEIKYIGTGFLLVKTDVYKKIGMPYYKVTYENEHWQGEDLNFCDRARASGYKIYSHGDLSKNLYHLGVQKYGYTTHVNNLSKLQTTGNDGGDDKVIQKD